MKRVIVHVDRLLLKGFNPPNKDVAETDLQRVLERLTEKQSRVSYGKVAEKEVGTVRVRGPADIARTEELAARAVLKVIAS